MSKSNSEVELLENFIFDYEIYLEQNEDNLTINFYSVSLFPQVEYYIIITKGKYLNDLFVHCFIQQILLNKDYFLKDMIFSNGEEEEFYKTINITNNLFSEEYCAIIIFAKEIHENYFIYRYYNPKEFKITKEEKGEKENEGDKENEKENNILIWIFISIGILLLIAIAIVITVFILKKRKKNKNIDLDINNLEHIL